MKKKEIKPFVQHSTSYIVYSRLEEFKKLPAFQQRTVLIEGRNHYYSQDKTIIKVDGHKLSLSFVSTIPKLGMNGNIYYKTTSFKNLWIDRASGKYGITRFDSLAIALKSACKEVKDFEFVQHIPGSILCQSVCKDILLGNITSPEQAMKKYLKAIKCSEFPWKVTLEALNEGLQMPLYVVKEIMINPISFLTDVSKCRMDYLEPDMITQCRVLRRKMDHRWSQKRQQEEHLQMTRLLMQEELEAKDNTPVWDSQYYDLLKEYRLELINTEMDAFEEGTMMHNCVYSNYWNKIKHKEYIVMHSVVEGNDISIGINLNCPTEIQQVYKRFNESLKPSEREYVEELIAGLGNVFLCMKQEAEESIPTSIAAPIEHPW